MPQIPQTRTYETLNYNHFIYDKSSSGTSTILNRLDALEAGQASLVSLDLLDNIATVPKPDPGLEIYLIVGGKSSKLDGGEGVFYWDESDTTTTVDDAVYLLVEGLSANGRWVRLREDTNYWSGAWYGLVGDDSTDNYAELAKWQNTVLETNNDNMNILDLKEGIYRYSRNTWIKNIRYLTIRGNGATIRCTSTSAFGSDKQCLNTSSMLTENGINEDQTLRAYKDTYGFQTASMGDKTVTFVTPGDGTNFAAGDKVFISGKTRLQAGGYPPSMERFEWKTVESVTANDITFSTVLQFDYEDRWYSQQLQLSTNPNHTFGEPTIIKYDEGIHIANIELILEGLTFRQNPNDNTRKLDPRPAEYLEIRNCICEIDYVPSITKHVLLINSDIWETIEADKLIETLVYERCNIGAISSAATSTLGGSTAVRNHVVRNCTIWGRVRATPIESLVVEGCNIVQGAGSTFGAIEWGEENAAGLYIIRNNTISRIPENRNPITELIGDEKSLTVVSVNGNNDILIADDATNRELVYDDLNSGAFIFTKDFTKKGIVRNIYNDGGGNIVLEGTWGNAAASDEFIWRNTAGAVIENNQVKYRTIGDGTTDTGVRQTNGIFLAANQAGPYYSVVVDSRSYSFRGNLLGQSTYGYVESIEVLVTKVYSGPGTGGAVAVQIEKEDGTGPTGTRAVIDLETLGYRKIHMDSSLNTTPLGTDDFKVGTLGLGDFWYKTRVLFKEGAGEVLTTDPNELAEGYIRFNIFNPKTIVSDNRID